MVDYVTLMLVNMTAGFFLLGCFVWQDIDNEHRQNWAPVFAITGLVAAVCGFVMTFTWPLPKPYSMAFGEMSVLLGVLLLGIRIIDLGLTKNPVLSGIGFVLSGTAGVFSPVVVWQQQQKGLRIVSALVLFTTSAIWAWTGYWAYWAHMAVSN